MAKDYEDLSMKEILSSIKTDILNSPYNKFDLKKGAPSDDDIDDEEIMNLIADEDQEQSDFFDNDDEPLELTEEVSDEVEEDSLNTNDSESSYNFRDVTNSISNSMQENEDIKDSTDIMESQKLSESEIQTTKPVSAQKAQRKKSSKNSLSSQNEEIDKFLEMIKSSDKDLSFPSDDLADAKSESSLISKTAENKSLRSIEKILDTKRKIRDEEERAQMRMRTTIDDLALAALTPMLRQWMDQNINRIVEEVIQKEIEKLIDKASGK